MFIKNTRYKQSKRLPDQPGLVLKQKPRIMVAIDTSGSISKHDLCDFFSEINHIYKSGVGVHLVEFDHAIQREYEYKGTWDGTVTGRGGTSFLQPTTLFNKNRQTYSTLVMFTDGYAPIKDLSVYGNCIWIITQDGCHQDYPGHVCYIPKNNE